MKRIALSQAERTSSIKRVAHSTPALIPSQLCIIPIYSIPLGAQYNLDD